MPTLLHHVCSCVFHAVGPRASPYTTSSTGLYTVSTRCRFKEESVNGASQTLMHLVEKAAAEEDRSTEEIMLELMENPRSTLRRIFTAERLMEMTGVTHALDNVRFAPLTVILSGVSANTSEHDCSGVGVLQASTCIYICVSELDARSSWYLPVNSNSQQRIDPSDKNEPQYITGRCI